MVLDAVNRCSSLPVEKFIELIDLWKTVEQGGQTTPPEIAFDEPIFVGNRKIYRPTYAVFRFMDRMTEYISDANIGDLATFWALENGRDAEALKNFHQEYKTILDNYIESLTLTADEIAQAIDAAFEGFPFRISAPNASVKKNGKDIDILATASSLVETYGKDFEYWIYDFNVQGIVWLSGINAVRYQDPEKPDPESPAIVAQTNFMNRRNQILLEYGKEDDAMVKKLRERLNSQL